jgi:hypothetical protein
VLDAHHGCRSQQSGLADEQHESVPTRMAVSINKTPNKLSVTGTARSFLLC